MNTCDNCGRRGNWPVEQDGRMDPETGYIGTRTLCDGCVCLAPAPPKVKPILAIGGAMSDPTPAPWTVYRCQFADGDGATESACGFNGQGLDASYDECHHTLSLADAELVIRAVNGYAAAKEVISWAQAVLTALNGGDVQSESLLHKKLREVMLAYRASNANI